MTSMRPFAFALLGVLTIAVVAPAHAQNNTKPAKIQKSAPASSMRNMDQKPAMMNSGSMSGGSMSGGMMAPGAGNNTAAVQANIDKANTTLNNMVALLNQIDARKKSP